MKCPNCRLINPESAMRCDCGYDFVTGLPSDRALGLDYRRTKTSGLKPSHRMMIGVGILFGGAIISGLSYLSSRTTGGSYLVASGAIVFGFIQFLIGMDHWFQDRREVRHD